MTTPAPAVNPSPAPTPIPTELERLGIHTPESLDSLCAKASQKPYVVEGFLPSGSIGIVVGDSGLGRTVFGEANLPSWERVSKGKKQIR
jgi:hypothetical protein